MLLQHVVRRCRVVQPGGLLLAGLPPELVGTGGDRERVHAGADKQELAAERGVAGAPEDGHAPDRPVPAQSDRDGDQPDGGHDGDRLDGVRLGLGGQPGLPALLAQVVQEGNQRAGLGDRGCQLVTRGVQCLTEVHYNSLSGLKRLFYYTI